MDFVLGSEVNLSEDYGHFSSKMTEKGQVALVLEKSLKVGRIDHYLLVVTAMSEQVIILYKQIHKNMTSYVIFCTKFFSVKKVFDFKYCLVLTIRNEYM